MNDEKEKKAKPEAYVAATIIAVCAVAWFWCVFAGPCSGGKTERVERTYENRREYQPETVKKPAEVDITTKAFAAGKVNNEIRIAGNPQVEFRSGRWEVYGTTTADAYYVVLDREAIWAVDSGFNLVGVLNKEACEWTPQAWVPPSYNPDVDYEALMRVLNE